MSKKSIHYLTTLRNIIIEFFSLDELRLLVVDLGLDWENIRGEIKSAKVQELLLQLGRQGRLEDLLNLLQRQRPLISWPAIPSPEQQKRDALVAFPVTPLYKQPWVWGMALVILALVGIFLVNTLPEQITKAFPMMNPKN